MENTMQNFKTETLMGELGSWNKQELKFKELFGVDALKDKEFQKMKLAAYDRLWLKYNDKGITTDEKSLLVMVKYQRTKMAKALYPGILRRLFRRAVNAVKNYIVKRAVREQLKRDATTYNYNTIPVPESYTQNGKEKAIDHKQPFEQRQRYGPDLGRKQKNNPNKRQGQSL